MIVPQIPPPSGELSNKPDKDTKKDLDFTGPSANKRVLYINAGIFKYGTDDKAHAASIALSMVLLAVSLIVMIVGLFSGNTQWLEKMQAWIGSAFLFVAGVAIGRGGKEKKPKNRDD